MENGEVKIVIHLKESCAIVGVQKKDTDPFVERVPRGSLEDVMNAVMGIIARAGEHWSQNPRNPICQSPPAPPPPTTPPRTPREPTEGTMQRLL